MKPSDAKVEIYTDGACRGNPGPGGWAAIIKTRDSVKELWGFEPQTTNNRMELTAVIEALKRLRSPSKVSIYTDSRYLKEGVTSWIIKWQMNGWKTSTGTPVKNRDLWELILKLSEPHQIEWHWIKGHNNHPENTRCDTLAQEAIEKSLRRMK
ncbi:MAG: ribonuclease HI [Syntrophobacterales bacterium]|nr:ribonuclease HI [Syntrophobacterales bacterium]